MFSQTQFLKIIFIFGCIESSSLYVNFLQTANGGYYLVVLLQASRYLQWLLLWAGSRHMWTSVVVGVRVLELVPAPLLRGRWDHPGPGANPLTPALEGRLPTTGPPGSPLRFSFLLTVSKGCWITNVYIFFSILIYGVITFINIFKWAIYMSIS